MITDADVALSRIPVALACVAIVCLVTFADVWMRVAYVLLAVALVLLISGWVKLP